jgi:hypothetical protein
MGRGIFPDDPKLASLHTMEAFDEEQMAAYVAKQLVAETEAKAFAEEAAMEAAVVEAKAEESAAQAATMADLQVQLTEARAELAAASAVARVRLVVELEGPLSSMTWTARMGTPSTSPSMAMKRARLCASSKGRCLHRSRASLRTLIAIMFLRGKPKLVAMQWP